MRGGAERAARSKFNVGAYVMTRAVRPLLWPLVPLYRLGLALRELQLRKGLKPVRRLRWPVVSVGSLSAGGAGKTPLTITLANVLSRRGLRVDVLSRGYGRRHNALPFLVDPGGTAEVFGDEPLEITREACVPVYVAAERYEAGVMAEEAGRPIGKLAGEQDGVHLLDDGFQHRHLHRDVDILLLSKSDLRDHLLPAGNLREALRAADRADVIAIPSDEPEVADWAKSRGWRAKIWRLRRTMEVPRCDGPVAAFCGIARPEQFFAGIEAAGVALAARFAFADHHVYTAHDLEGVVAEAQGAGASALLTTEKDRARLGRMAASLSGSILLQPVKLQMEIENEAAAMDWLAGRLRATV
jgi:tetraacyldisaccharide 4'-kinase